MTHQQNLDAVRAACVRANPEKDCPIEDYGNYCPTHAITLPDVLLALGKVNDRHIQAIRFDGVFVDQDGCSMVAYPPEWNLRLPLSGQTPETVAYLANLLK